MKPDPTSPAASPATAGLPPSCDPGQPLLLLQDIRVAHAGQDVVRGLSLDLACGDIGCLLGPSGCGKTTALRAIAGFEPLTGGGIRLAGAEVSRPGWQLPPERRGVGMVFQDFALFPHLNVAANVAFGLRDFDRDSRERRVAELLERTGLAAHADHYPHELSGGQQQRVAIARALAPGPRLLLLDEPFSSLDVALRERLGRELHDMLHATGTTALMVTHSQQEAFAMADRIGVMQDGRLCQWDRAWDLYHHPRDRFVARFIGEGVLVPARVRDDGAIDSPLGVLHGQLPPDTGPGSPVEMLLRPDDLVHDDDASLHLPVVDRVFRGAEILYTLELPEGTRVLCLAPSHHDHPEGQPLAVRLDAEHVVIFAAP